MFIKKMKSNINELVDFEKLRESNSILHKWTQRLNISKRDYMKTVHQMFKNPKAFKTKFEVRFRSQFTKDCAVMFYASTVENTLCEQYSAMVANIIRGRFKIRDDDFFENHFNDGLMAIRAATWQFRKHKSKASFNTFVHHAIFMRIKGTLCKNSDKAKRRMGYAKVYRFSDYPETTKFDNVGEEYYPDDSVAFEKQISMIIREAGLSEQEQFMLSSYINRKVDNIWYDDYRKKYRNVKMNKQYSRQSIHNQLLAVQNKVLEFMKYKKLVDDDFKIKAER